MEKGQKSLQYQQLTGRISVVSSGMDLLGGEDML
jgi:hypothetical protein